VAAPTASLATRRPGRAAARHVVAWRRVSPTGTAVLLHGAKDFHQPDWPAAERERLGRANRRVVRAVRDLATSLGDTSPLGLDRARLAIIDLPYSVVRRHGGRLPAHAEDLAAEGAAALLSGSSFPGTPGVPGSVAPGRGSAAASG
jgi:hypothetical protein